MNESRFLKGSCSECGNHLEFPESAVDSVVDCPHCGKSIALTAEESEDAPSAESKSKTLPIALTLLALLCAAGAGFYFFNHRSPDTPVAAKSPIPMANPTQPTNAAAASSIQSTNPPSAPAEPPPPKSISDFHTSTLKLEKTAGSSLVYVVGQLENRSPYQRFGITIVFDLMDAAGGKIGTAKDYVDVIEPHATWQFHALVPFRKAASASVASIEEK